MFRERRPRPAARWRVWLVRILVGVTLLVAVAWSLPGRGPDPAEVIDVFRTASMVWLAGALLAIVVSVALFGLQQRYLLAAFGAEISRTRSVALAFAQSAVTSVLPAGWLVATGFTFRQFRSYRAAAGEAMAVILLSGLFSTIGTVWLYLVIVSFDQAPGAVVPVVGLVAALWWLPVAARAVPSRRVRPIWTARISRYERITRFARSVSDHRREFRTAVQRLSPTMCLGVTGLAVLTRAGEVACLLLVARALHAPVGLLAVAVAVVAMQLARLLPFTVGGHGVIEAALLVVLVSAGMEVDLASAVTVGFRLLSCWLIVLCGLPITMLLIRAAPLPTGAATPQEVVP